jgi:hypothetical protein
MHRRTLLQALAALVAALHLPRLRAAPAATPLLDASALQTLESLAGVVLPSTLGPAGHRAVVASFSAWLEGYREGADRGHDYGLSKLLPAAPASPATRYPAQLAALDAAARARGAARFADLSAEDRQRVASEALAAVQRLPALPDGENLVADLMGHYFRRAEAWNLCYRADISWDACRGLEGSEARPAPLAGGAA